MMQSEDGREELRTSTFDLDRTTQRVLGVGRGTGGRGGVGVGGGG